MNSGRWHISGMVAVGFFHRAQPCFFAFDILSRDGRDLRLDSLIDRKAELRRLLASRSA
jgi:ATP-dependent DNA ligase